MENKINNYIKEDYCSQKVYNLLKEKGYDCKPVNTTINTLYVVYNAGFNHGSNEGPFPEHGTFDAFSRCINGESPLLDNVRYDIAEKVKTIPTHSFALKWVRINFNFHISSSLFEGKYYFSIKSLSKKIALENGQYDSDEEAIDAGLLYCLTYLTK